MSELLRQLLLGETLDVDTVARIMGLCRTRAVNLVLDFGELPGFEVYKAGAIVDGEEESTLLVRLNLEDVRQAREERRAKVMH